MHIDHKPLEAWLHGKLKPLTVSRRARSSSGEDTNTQSSFICVADPVPLSQYVIALIKKDKSEKELKEICIDQLEVFLQENTSSFVADLFAALKTRSYVQSEVTVADTQAPPSSDSTAATKRTATSDHARADAHKDKKRHAPNDSTISGSESSSSAPRQKRKRSNSSRPKSATRSRSRSRSPPFLGRNPVSSTDGSSRTGRRSGDQEVVSDEGRTRSMEYDGHLPKRDSDHVGRRGAVFGNTGRTEPSWHDRRSKPKELDTRRSRLSRERYRSPDNDRYGGRPRNLEADRGVTDRGPDVTRRRRCRTFDERGFCVFGAQCPYDHGPEALVLPSTRAAAVAITQMSASTTYANSNLLSLPDSSSTTPEKQLPPTQQQVSLRPQVAQIQSVVSAVIPTAGGGSDVRSSTNATLGFDANDRAAVPVYRPTPIKQPASSSIETIDSTDIQISPAMLSVPPPTLDGYPWNIAGFNLPAYAQTTPLAGSARTNFGSVAVRPNVIPIPLATTVANSMEPDVTTCSAPPAYEPDKPHISMISNAESAASPSVEMWSAGGETSSRPSITYTPSPISERLVKATFSSAPPTSSTPRDSSFPCVLYITHIPWRLNDEFKLREHFSRFGTLIRVVSRYYSIPDAALVEFSSTDEAEKAYRSPEPILSNRFIRLSTMPPNKFGYNRRGRHEPYDLRPKSMKERLGQRPAPTEDKYGWLRSALDTNTSGPADPVPKKGGRSRWRLERNANGLLEDVEDEEEGEDQMAVDDAGNNRHGLVDYTVDRPLDDDTMDLSDQNRLDGGKSRFSLSRTSKSETEAYLWERQKALALKQRAELIKQLDKSREAKQSLLEAQRLCVLRLRNQLKKILSQLEGQSEAGDAGDATSTTERRRLLDEAKRIQAELATALANEKKCLANLSSKKEVDDTDPMTLGSTTISAAALQALPEPVATERRKQIAEVRAALKLVEEDMAVLKAKGEPVTEQCRRILELKRQLVQLETVRPSDLAAIGDPTDASGSIYSRNQTKLDKRPRTLFVSGLTVDDIEDFQRALSLNYLYTQHIVKHNYSSADQPVLEVTFCTRDFAERAMRQFHQFRGRSLQMSFAPPPADVPATTITTENVASSVVSSTQGEI